MVAKFSRSALASLPPTSETLVMLLMITREQIMTKIRPVLRSHGVTEQQWRVLRVVSEHEQISAVSVAELACLRPPSLTRILRILMARGYIFRHQDTTDGRRVLVQISDSGMQLLNDVAPEMARLKSRLRDMVGCQQWDDLIKRLHEVSNRIV